MCRRAITACAVTPKIDNVTTALLSALYAIVLTTAFAAFRVRPLATPHRARWPWATTVAVIIVGIPTLAQFTVAPWLLNSLERNWTLIARGQVWRLLTSLVVQDGGVASVPAYFLGRGPAQARRAGSRVSVALAEEHVKGRGGKVVWEGVLLTRRR